MNSWFVWAFFSAVSGLGMALLCMMISTFGYAVYSLRSNNEAGKWFYGTGDKIMDCSMVFLPLGFFVAIILAVIGFISEYI